jgi:hypothetical protein
VLSPNARASGNCSCIALPRASMPSPCARPFGLVLRTAAAMHGRGEPRAKAEARSRWIPAFAGMTMGCGTATRPSCQSKGQELDPGFRRDDVRRNWPRGSERSEACFCAQGCAPLSPGPLGRGEAGSDQPVGARGRFRHPASNGTRTSMCSEEARAFSPVHGRTVENPGPDSRTRSAGEGMDARGRAMQEQLPDARRGASAGCPFFCLLFLWTSKEK